MITKIGITAGEIWEYLDNHGKSSTLEGMISGLGKDRDHILMSIGWLAREGHIILEGDGSSYTVTLSPDEKTDN
jgi:hypothetical protein